MTIETLAAIATFVLLFGIISRRIEHSIVTPPMAFVALGILLGPQLLGLVTVDPDSAPVRLLAELTLVLVLFTDASRIDLKLLFRERELPLRLLSVGLALNVVLGTLAALVLFGGQLTPWEAAVLATILAPTDAALGQATMTDPRVPVCIRQTLNVESGLNDGLCLPVLLIFLSLASLQASTEPPAFWLALTGKQLLLGPVVGVAVGYVGGFAIARSIRWQWSTQQFQDLAVLSLPILAFALAEAIGGNGFLAAFCAGLTLGNTAHELCQCVHEFGEAEGQLLVLLAFAIYGAVMVFPALADWQWQIGAYAVFSLTIARSAGVAASVWGEGLRWETISFLGWFGPRGIASILYGLLMLERGNLASSELIFHIMAVTVLLSVFTHGLTALPGTRWYAHRMASAKGSAPELTEVREMPVRLPWR